MSTSQLLLSFAAAVSAALLSGVLTWAIRPRICLIRFWNNTLSSCCVGVAATWAAAIW